jgi:hypothetical protein
LIVTVDIKNTDSSEFSFAAKINFVLSVEVEFFGSFINRIGTCQDLCPRVLGRFLGLLAFFPISLAP